MSAKKEVFKKVGERLFAKLINLEGGLPNLAMFDKQMGQFENPELTFAIPLPCVLLEFGQFNYTTISQNQQKGDGSLRIYIYFENYSNSFTGAIDQELALRFFEFTEAVHKALQGFGISGLMAPLERVADAEDVAQDMIITSIMDYNTVVYDDSADETKNFTEVDPDVEVEYKKTSSRPVDDNEPLFLTA